MSRVRFALTGLFCVGLAGVAAAAEPSTTTKVAPGPVIRVSKETTHVSGPVDANGYVDFLAALNEHYGKGVKLSENAAELLLEAIGSGTSSQTVSPSTGLTGEINTLNQVREKLGMPAVSPQSRGLYTIGHLSREKNPNAGDTQLGEYSQSLVAELDAAMSRPWTEDEFPRIATIIERNTEALSLVHQAVRRPKYFRAYTLPKPDATMVSILLPDIQQHRELARLLKSRALLKLAAGDVDAARDDLFAMHRLARCSGKGMTIIEGLVGIAIDAMASHGDTIWANQPGVKAEQLAAYRTQLAKLPAVTDLVDRIDHCERLFLLEIMQKMAIGAIPTEESQAIFGFNVDGTQTKSLIDVGSLMKGMSLLAIDWNVAMADANRVYDGLVVAGRTTDRTQRLALYEQWEQRLKQEKARLANQGPAVAALRFVVSSSATRGKDISGLLSTLLLPAVKSATLAEDAGRLRIQMTQVALALAEHRVREGQYPESLDTLVPRYLPELPQDSFAGAALHYDTDGAAYRLYSVGRNGRDDGGATGNGADDLVFSDPAQP